MNVTGKDIDITLRLIHIQHASSVTEKVILEIIHILLAITVTEKVTARMLVGFYTQKRNQNDLKSVPSLPMLQ
jgi:hypothetical protein